VALWERRSGDIASRDYTAMTYDSLRNRIILFGGQISGSYSNELWEWDGANWFLGAASGPSPRYLTAIAYDPVRHESIVFSGNGAPSNDTWAWDGTNWTLKSNTGPAYRQGHALAFHDGRG